MIFCKLLRIIPIAEAPLAGYRTMLGTPLLREGVPIGTIAIRRTEVRPFSEKQIKLLETFASQAVIAIENVRLFKELQERNSELREALEHQTATSEVLGIISRSPTDAQPVLDAIVESAARVCGIDDVLLRLHEGNTSVVRAHFGPVPTGRVKISIDNPRYHWLREHGALHIPDLRAQNDFPMLGPSSGSRTLLLVPLCQQGELIGNLTARRIEVRPFTPAQIKLLETFADQAVIAIENVRLFNELKESLEQQTATSEILSVIASSPTDIQPVLDTVAKNAARLCEAADAQIRLVEGDGTRLVASFGDQPSAQFSPVGGRAILNRETVHVHDLLEAAKNEFPEAEALRKQTGTRTMLATPMLREGTPIGVINVRRTEVRPFSERQIKLVETFAAQAMIAIENVRLFNELDTRNRDLTEALEQQTATSEILRVIASSPTDIQPVLDVVAQNASRLCDASDAAIWRTDGDKYWLVASHGSIPVPRSGESRPMTRSIPSGRAMVDKETVHVHDILSPDSVAEFPEAVRIRRRHANCSGYTIASRRACDRSDSHSAQGGPSVYRKANFASQNLRRSSSDCHRECSPVPRTGSKDERIGSLGWGTQSVGRGRSGGQHYSGSSNSTQHHRAPRGSTLRNRLRSHLRVR